MAEYDVERRLVVQYCSTATPNVPLPAEIDLHLEILHAYKPFTMSVVCHVRLIPSLSLPLPFGLPPTCILKLFDRRYASNVRKADDHHPARPYTAAREEAHQHLLLEGSSVKAIQADILDEAEDYEQDESDWGGIEAAIERSCQLMYLSEVQAYDDLRDLQGSYIPVLYGPVRYHSPIPPPADNDDVPSAHRYTAQGILLEQIPSTTLSNYLRTAMQSDSPSYDAVAEVCDQAIGVMDRIDDFNVLNDDVRLDNILVATIDAPATTSEPLTPLSSSFRRHRVVCVDFANSRLRYPDETDEQWRRAKQNQNEQGTVGVVAALLLRDCAREKKSKVAKAGRSKGVGGDVITSKGQAAKGLETAEQGRLWSYPPLEPRRRRWYRELNKEEMEIYLEEFATWGLHPQELSREKP